MSSTVTYNERSWAIDIIAEMKLIKEPSNRQTWHILKSSSFTYIKINKRKKLIFSINN